MEISLRTCSASSPAELILDGGPCSGTLSIPQNPGHRQLVVVVQNALVHSGIRYTVSTLMTRAR